MNKKYIVNFHEIHVLPVEIEAENIEDAIEKAKSAVASGAADIEKLEYSHTLDVGIEDVEEIL